MMGWIFSIALFVVGILNIEYWYLLIASGLFAIAGSIAVNCGK